MEKPRNLNKIIESAPFEKYGLKFAGIGEENVCFEVAGSTKKLIKVNTNILRRKLLLMNDLRLKDVPISDLNQEESIEEYEGQEKNIKEIFGNEHVLSRGVFHKKIPLTKESISIILGKEGKDIINQFDDNKDYEVEMLIHTQLIAEELKNPELYKTRDYSIDLMFYHNFKNSKDIDEGLRKIEKVSNGFVLEFEKILKNKEYSGIIKEITEKIIQYTKKTGLMLDVFGSCNITMFIDKDGKENFHLLDVILPGPMKDWSLNIKDDKELGLLRHAYTYYYSIKSLAEKIGIVDNLNPEDLLYFKGSTIPTGNWPSSNS